MRAAIVTGGADSLEQVKNYLPDNYEAVAHYVKPLGADRYGQVIIIAGQDIAGWTLDGYVIPRLMSGLIGAEEIAPF